MPGASGQDQETVLMSAPFAKAGLIVLAAGASTRMGRPKQLLRYRGRSLLQHSLDTALATAFRPIVVVLGAYAEQMEVEIEGTEVLAVRNGNWATGMGSSVASGLSALLHASPDVEAAFFILVDQPYLGAAHLQQMAQLLQRSPHMLGVVSAYGQTTGVPALFSKALFPELLALKGPKGAKPVVMEYRDELLAVPFPEGRLDLDTPGDWLGFQEKLDEP